MRVTLHTDFASLASHLAEWNQLAQSVPFRLWQWVAAWWRHYGCDESSRPKRFHQLFVLSVWNDERQLIGIAPWYRLHTRSGTRVVRCLGDGEVCSDHLTVLCRPESEAAVSDALAEWLTESALNGSVEHNRRWDRLELTGIDADNSPINCLLSELHSRGNLVHRSPALSSWQVALKPTWDEFLMVLSKPHRNRLRRADRNFIQSGRVVVRHVHDESELPAAFDVLIALHQPRWQQRGMPGCFASPLFQAFHREIAARLFLEGQANIGWLELDGKPLAAEYRFFGGDVAYAYQCGIDVDRLDIQPGELANMVAVRSAIEHGRKTFDFLRGDEPYKAHWRATARPMLAVRVVPDRVAARFRHTTWLAGQNMKCWIKGGLKLAGLRKQQSTTSSGKQTTHHGVTEDTEQQVEA